MAYISTTVAPTYGTVNPNNGGYFFNVLENKWYDPSGVVVTKGINFLDAIVYGDTSGNAEYIEQLPKTVYYDRVKANRYEGKNACTAWVNFDGTTTPPTIRDSFNVSQVIRTATGTFDVYFEEEMDSSNYSVTVVNSQGSASNYVFSNTVYNKTVNKCSTYQYRVSSTAETAVNGACDIQIFGGKN